jgi:hypothetical protein
LIFQTPKGTPNYVGIFMLSNMKGKMRRPDGECDMDGDSSSEQEKDIKKDTMQVCSLFSNGLSIK